MVEELIILKRKKEMLNLMKIKVPKNTGNDAIHADKLIKFCLKCRNCWYLKVTFTRLKGREYLTYNMAYLKDFPSYGKKKENCPKCLGQKYIRTIKREENK